MFMTVITYGKLHYKTPSGISSQKGYRRYKFGPLPKVLEDANVNRKNRTKKQLTTTSLPGFLVNGQQQACKTKKKLIIQICHKTFRTLFWTMSKLKLFNVRIDERVTGNHSNYSDVFSLFHGDFLQALKAVHLKVSFHLCLSRSIE